MPQDEQPIQSIEDFNLAIERAALVAECRYKSLEPWGLEHNQQIRRKHGIQIAAAIRELKIHPLRGDDLSCQ